MKKLLVIFFIILCSSSYSQLYKRAWGTLLPIDYKSCPDPLRRPCNLDTIYFYNNNHVTHVDQKANTLYHTDRNLNRIYKITPTNPLSSLFYTIPHSGGGTSIECIKKTSKGELILFGRTLVNGLATSGAYSTTPIITVFTGSGYIAKIDTSGRLVWFTYFHPLIQNVSNLTLDNNDNIYVLTNREKNETLTTSTFQSNGDPNHPLSYMNAISKLDTNGKHQWSTFYSKDQSVIRSIAAGTNGVYIYGEHLDSNANSNYFGSTGSFQEYATGMTTGGTNNASNVFLSKFNFNGTRAWSTYFGKDKSYTAHNNILLNNNSLVVINDDAYILTNHEIRPGVSKNITTKGVFLESSVTNSQIDITLSKFLGNGQRDWTTFLHTGNVIQTNNNELFISSVVRTTNPFSSNLTTTNAYQRNHGGTDDAYNYTLTTDGKKRNYASYYGFVGMDNGVALPTAKGFFYIGYTYNNASSNATHTFATTNAPLKKYFSDYNNVKINSGNFLSYFTTESVSNYMLNEIQFNIYPNPVTDILNIQSKEHLPESTSLIVYDVAGKQVLNKLSENSNLNQINVSQLNSGIYILQIDGSNLNYSFKFIKN